MKKVSLLIITIALILTSCKSPKYILTNSTTSEHYIGPTYIYYLPKTKIIVDIQATKIVENKGPYADYADEFLGGLRNVIKQNRTYWEITDIQINTIPVRDTNQIWFIHSEIPINLILSKEGFPVALNTSVDSVPTLSYTTESFVSQEAEIKDKALNITTLDKGYKEVYDTIFRIETYDTIQRTIPIIKSRLVKKSIREQARELADEIFTLKDDKEALLVGEGDSEYLPDGEALKIMLQGIDELIAQYVAQFVGKIEKYNYHYRFNYIPEPKNIILQQIICRFSPKLGILPATDLRGEPIILEIESLNYTQKIKTFSQNQALLIRIEKPKDTKRGFAYRIPEQAIIRVKLGKRVLAQKQVFIAQFGVINYLSKEQVIKNKIEFYPELGAIKSITK